MQPLARIRVLTLELTMGMLRPSTFALLFSWLALIVGVATTINVLPIQLASHFGADGQPNGWMDRGSYAFSILALGFGLPAFILLIHSVVKLAPPGSLSVPNATYWREPSNFPRAMAYFMDWGRWLCVGIVLFILFVHLATVEANNARGGNLDGRSVATGAGCFMAFIAFRIILMMRRFARKT